MVRNLLHRAGGAREFPFLEWPKLIFSHGHGVDKTDVAIGKLTSCFTDNALHLPDDLLRLHGTVIHREFYENQIRAILQHIMFHPKNTQQ